MKNKTFALSMAVLFCIVFGTAMHDLSLGVVMGLCMGLVFGLFDPGDAPEKGKEASGAEEKTIAAAEDPITLRPLEETERDAALALAWKVFSAYESPDYPPEGTEEFRKTLQNEDYLAGIRYYGAFDGETLIGLLGIRGETRHICFFFVDGAYHRRGIGTRLFRRVCEDYPGLPITLNAAPYGLPFYEKLGFTATEEEQTVNGIRFTPMMYKGEREHADH